MALIARVSRLFKADLHAVLDELEEPASLLRQSIREMDEALTERERQIKQLQLECRLLEKRARDADAQPALIDAKLDLCFANGNDELARKLTRRKLQAQRLCEHIGATLNAMREQVDTERSAYEEDRQRLESMRQKADCFSDPPRSRTAAAHDMLDVGDDEVEIAFLHERALRTSS
jgi:phage shock protein A